MNEQTCTYKPSCSCSRCASMALAVEDSDCEDGACGSCDRCLTINEQVALGWSAFVAQAERDFDEFASDEAIEAQEENERRLADFQEREAAAMREVCIGGSTCPCDRCDAERELAANESLRRWSAELEDMEDELAVWEEVEHLRGCEGAWWDAASTARRLAEAAERFAALAERAGDEAVATERRIAERAKAREESV